MPSHRLGCREQGVTFLPFSLKVKWVTWKKKKLLLCLFLRVYVSVSSMCHIKLKLPMKEKYWYFKKRHGIIFSLLKFWHDQAIPCKSPSPSSHPGANFKALIHQTAVRHSELWWLLLQNRFVHKMDSVLLFLKKSPVW